MLLLPSGKALVVQLTPKGDKYRENLIRIRRTADDKPRQELTPEEGDALIRLVPATIVAIADLISRARDPKKLDKNFVGVPEEAYAASNNPKKKMGPPNFEEAKFEMAGHRVG